MEVLKFSQEEIIPWIYKRASECDGRTYIQKKQAQLFSDAGTNTSTSECESAW